MTDAQIKYMVERFLQWRLPEDFNPDGGISFKPMFNEHTAHPRKAEPVGTNLFDYTQTEAMVRYIVEGMPPAAVPASPVTAQRETICSGFVVNVKCHTEDALNKITSPEALRFQIGYMMDSWGLQEEVDYTLEVSRTYETK